MKSGRALLLALVTASAVIVACGGDDNGGGDRLETSPTITIVQNTAAAPTPQLQEQPAIPQPLDEAASAAVDGMISIEAKETRFAPNRWSAPLGEPITIRVTNNDTQQHDLRIAGLDGLYDTEDDAVTIPDELEPGEIGELTFAPLIPGDYSFRCDIHPGAMGGRIEVQP